MTINVEKRIDGSKYFYWGEALYLPRIDDYHMPSAEEMINIQKLAFKLDVVREFIKQPFKINCWIRPVSSNTHKKPGTNYNQLVGGANGSTHISGKAVDGYFLNTDLDETIEKLIPKLADFNLSMEQNGSKYKRMWIHLEDKPKSDGLYRVFLP